MTRRLLQGILGVLVTLGAGLQLQAQEQPRTDRLDRLESEIKRLTDENASLRRKVDGLEADMERQATLDEAGLLTKSKLEVLTDAMLQDQTQFGSSGGDLFSFINSVRFIGEWRTRFDVRSNTVDLFDGIDDDGFRLDYRFNLALEFEFAKLGLDETEEDGVTPKSKTGITTRFEIQSVGRGANNTAENIPSSIGTTVGEFATRENDLDVVRLYQAWLRIENMFRVSGLNLTAGRQELNFGSMFILGTNEFYTGTVHDAVRLDWDFEGISSHHTLFYAKEAAADGQITTTISTGGLLSTQSRASGDEDEMLGLYNEFKFADPLMIDFYYVYFNARSAGVGIRPDNITSPTDPAIDALGRNSLIGQINTIGTRLFGEDLLTDGLFLSLEVAYQFGQDEESDDLSALGLEFLAEYRLPFMDKDNGNGRLFAGYYFAEGPDSGVTNGFSPLFISRHNLEPVGGKGNVAKTRSRHGPYSRLGNVDMIPTQNIHVIQAGFIFDPWEDWTMGLTYLYSFFNHSRELLTANQIGNVFVDERSLGHEVDLYARYRLGGNTDIFFNLSVFVPDTDFAIEQASAPGTTTNVGTDTAVGAYIQIRVSF